MMQLRKKSSSTVNGQRSMANRESSDVNRQTSNVKRQTSNFQLWVFILSLSCLLSCNSPYIPKPAGYFKIDLPEKKYQSFNQPGYPYTFEYPTYANVVKDSTFFGDATENPWWINVEFPQFSARIYLSYKIIGQYKLDSLLNDAFNLTNKHSVKASYIDDSLMNISENVHGEFFKVEGDVATANQFFLTDSTKNFLRGALYFDATPNEDSLRPVNTFLVDDMKHLINTFRWK
jgi:gliding motility-associated lipoprotein GldD